MMRTIGLGVVFALALCGGWFVVTQGTELWKDLAFVRASRYAAIAQAQQRAAVAAAKAAKPAEAGQP